MSERDWEAFATSLAEMARTLLAADSLQKTLDQIARYAVELVDGCEQAGVLVVERREQVRTLAATGDLVHLSDRRQQENREGPCFDAARRSHPVYRIADMTTTVERWPRYAPHARELGVGSMMGFLLYTEDDDLGALNMYSSRPKAFTEHSERVGWLLASHAAVAFSSARSHAQLEAALDSRNDIGEALGIVMERYKVGEDEAFAVLRKSSQDHNVKLRDLARRVAHTGEIPGAR